MSNELTVQDEDGFDVQERSSNFIIGGMIKYNKGYILNKTEEPPPDITLLVRAIITCWVKWENNSPAEHRVTRSGQIHPQREDLPDQDQSFWEIGLDGVKPADPWKDTRYIHLINLQTGQDFTFVTDTWGGRMATGELKSSIRNIRMAHPNAMPIVKLGHSSFMSRRFGEVARPSFVIVGWHQGLKEVPAQSEQQLLAPAQEQLNTFAESAEKPAEQTVSELPQASLSEEMNDAIPDFDEDTPETKAAVPPSRPRRELKKTPTKADAEPASKKQNIRDAS
jgi:hypothetical protein